MPQCSRNYTKVGLKHQPINQLIDLFIDIHVCVKEGRQVFWK